MVGKGRLPLGSAHLVGAGGYGMRGLARLLLEEGRSVSGSDSSQGEAVSALIREGVRYRAGELPSDTAFVVHSAAVPQSHAEIRQARERRIPCYKYAEALGRLCEGKRVVACSGTHGKSTATALMAYLLRQAGIGAGYIIGGDPAPGTPGFQSNSRLGDPMVVEACEFDFSFLNFRPWAALITNVELEHVDCFPGEKELFDAFARFAGQVVPGGVVVAPSRLAGQLSGRSGPGTKWVGFGPGGSWQAERRCISGGTQEVCVKGPEGVELELPLALAGEHNVSNLGGVMALVCELYGAERFTKNDLGLERFRGLRRRFEVLWESESVIVDDYAHHPTEVEATLRAARERYPEARRLIAVFQPHQCRRLEAFSEGFARALVKADMVLVTPVFAAREGRELRNSASSRFSRHLSALGSKCSFCEDFMLAKKELIAGVSAGDVVVFLGAGNVTDLASEVAGELAGKEKANGPKV